MAFAADPRWNSRQNERNPGQPDTTGPKKPAAWRGQQRGPDDYEKDQVGRYAKYFKSNEILPIPEIVEKISPRVLSLVVSDIKTKRLVGLNKDTFEKLLRKAGIPCQYFCRKKFCHMGCPASSWIAGSESGCERRNHKALQVTAEI